MPALWDEPFGITLIEALVSGTPVLGTRRGSLPEIVSPEVGALGDTLEELVALRARLDAIDAGRLPGARGAALHPSRDGGGVPADVPGVSGDGSCRRGGCWKHPEAGRTGSS